MKSRGVVIFFISGLIIALGGISVFLLFRFAPAQSNTLLNWIPFFSRQDEIKQFGITDEVHQLTYNFDESIHDHSKVVEQLRGTDVDIFKKQVIIHSDPNKRGASFLKAGVIIGGYGHYIDYTNGVVYLYIYINPELTDNQEILHNINKGYVGALLSAVETNKHDLDPSYTADYVKVRNITHEISVENYDKQYSFITYDQPK